MTKIKKENLTLFNNIFFPWQAMVFMATITTLFHLLVCNVLSVYCTDPDALGIYNLTLHTHRPGTSLHTLHHTDEPCKARYDYLV